MEGVRGVVARWNKGEVRIITSTIMLTEVTPAQIPEPALSLFDKALRRRTFKVVGVDQRIARLAANLRDHYAKIQGSKSLATPDALHLATAIIHEADEFHTFDGGDDNRTLGLLGLSGNVAGHKLKIDKPPPNRHRERWILIPADSRRRKKSGKSQGPPPESLRIERDPAQALQSLLKPRLRRPRQKAKRRKTDSEQ